MSRKQPKEQHGIVPISIAIMFLIMAFGALSTMGRSPATAVPI